MRRPILLSTVLLFKLPLYESFMEARPTIALVQTIAEFPRAVVLLFKLPLYESLLLAPTSST